MTPIVSYLHILFLVVIGIANYIFNYELVELLILYSLYVNFILLYSYRSNQSFLILFLFAITYPIFILISYVIDVPYHIYMEYQNEKYTSGVFLIQTFSLLIMFLRNKNHRYESFNWFDKISVRSDPCIFYASIFILSLMIPLSIAGKSTLLSTGAYNAETESSILFEYCLIFIITSWLYSGGNKLKILLIVIVSSFFLVLPLLFGKRLPFLIIATLLFNLFGVNRVSNKYILLTVIGMLVFLSIIASYRIGGDSHSSFFNTLINVNEYGVMSNNQGGVVVSASSYLGLVDNEKFDWLFRLTSLLGMLVSPLTMGSFSVPEAYINTSAMNYTPIPGNGGLPGVYFYIWGSFPGVIIFSSIFSLIFNNVGKNRYLSVFALFLLVTFPRWYAYNMIIVFKMGFWLLFITFFFDRVYKMRNKNVFDCRSMRN